MESKFLWQLAELTLKLLQQPFASPCLVGRSGVPKTKVSFSKIEMQISMQSLLLGVKIASNTYKMLIYKSMYLISIFNSNIFCELHFTRKQRVLL